jgi:hypothetical protein
MASYFSSLLTTTTSRVASIRQNLLPTENDGDTEDDTHLCRVLRAYYTEKGRSFPAWLPPDPKAPPPPVVTPVYAQSGVGSRYGGMQATAGSGGALSSLWDSQPAQPAQEPQSLRQGRAPASSRFGAQAAGGGQRQNPFARQQQQSQPEQVQARPLPSQRAGSYQTTGFNQTPPGSSSGPMSAKDRLAGRLGQKGRAASPATAPSPRMAESSQVQRANSYGSSNAGGGGNYEDRFAPSGAGYGGGGGDKPFVAATSPWASSEAEFGGGGYGGGYDAPPARTGLPSGPAAGRRGPGLPSGPRGMR